MSADRPNPNSRAPALQDICAQLPLERGHALFIPVIGDPEVRRRVLPGSGDARKYISDDLDTVNLWDDYVMFVDDFGCPAAQSLVLDKAKGLPINPLASRLYREVRGAQGNIYGPAVIVRDSDFA